MFDLETCDFNYGKVFISTEAQRGSKYATFIKFLSSLRIRVFKCSSKQFKVGGKIRNTHRLSIAVIHSIAIVRDFA